MRRLSSQKDVYVNFFNKSLLYLFIVITAVRLSVQTQSLACFRFLLLRTFGIHLKK